MDLVSWKRSDSEVRGDCEGMVHCVVIVGAGPAGLATAALLRSKGVPFLIVDKEDCSSSLWKKMTYDRLHLHLPKRFCQLPLRPFPGDYPKYPSRDQMVAYLDDYQRHFGIAPMLQTTVTRAEFVAEVGAWVVTAEQRSKIKGPAGDDRILRQIVLLARVLVVATGENGEAVMASLPGRSTFRGDIIHAKEYRSAHAYQTQRVLVVGTGNSGMEVALDLANSGVQPTLVARNPFHVMPRDLMGGSMSTFEVTMKLIKVFPIWFVDNCLVLLSWLSLGSASKFHLTRPREGPLHMKARTKKTPVLDVGTVAKLRGGDIKVVPGIDRLTERGARFVNGVEADFDVIVMATGYTSTVSKWLKGDVSMFGEDGFPRRGFPNGWKGENGLYAVGFGRQGLLGCAHDAVAVANDIAKEYCKSFV